MMEFIVASAQRQYSLTDNTSLSEMMGRMLQHPQMVSLQDSRAMFFLLLNVDMPLKEYVCDTQNKERLAVALNLTTVSEATGKHAYAMTGARTPDCPKLESFFVKLSSDIVPKWLQNQSLSINDFVHTIRNEYIVS
jgi:hypothetical protein